MVQLSKSTKPIKASEINRDWRLIDVKGKILGRIVSESTKFLQGKHKVSYTPNLDSGDYVVIINARQIKLTGKKAQNKVYTRYSGYPGGLKKISFQDLKKNRPSEILKHAISGMLPKNKLRDRRLARLFIYPDDKHPYKDKINIPKADKS